MLSTQDLEEDENDNVILDDEEQAVNFTSDLYYMAGAPYPPEVKEYIRNSNVQIPKHLNHLSDTSATKTQFKQNLNFKDFEFKKANLMLLQQL